MDFKQHCLYVWACGFRLVYYDDVDERLLTSFNDECHKRFHTVSENEKKQAIDEADSNCMSKWEFESEASRIIKLLMKS